MYICFTLTFTLLLYPVPSCRHYGLGHSTCNTIKTYMINKMHLELLLFDCAYTTVNMVILPKGKFHETFSLHKKLNPIDLQGHRLRSQLANMLMSCKHNRDQSIECILIKLGTHIDNNNKINSTYYKVRSQTSWSQIYK